jgi:hypothetical protein
MFFRWWAAPTYSSPLSGAAKMCDASRMGRGDTTDNDDEGRSALISQLREAYGRVAYTHKTHQKSADIITRHFRQLQLAQVILSAVTTSGIILIFFDKESVHFKALSGLAALALTVLSFYMKSGKHAETAAQHIDAANKLWLVRERFISLLTDFTAQSLTLDDARRVRDSLQDQQAELYKTLPQTDSPAYAKAQEALKKKEEMYFTDTELDRMLPGHLRVGRRPKSSSASQRTE